MKKLFIFLGLWAIGFMAYSQDNAAVDKEKLFDLYQTQRYADAAQYLKSIYGEETTDIKALNQMGYCFIMAGNNVEAEKFYGKAYAQQPQNLSILFSLGSINTKRGNSQKARQYYGEIVKIDSSNFNVYKLLANLYSSSIDSMKLVYLSKANTLNPIEADVAIDLAEVYAVHQEHEKAYNVLDIAIKGDTNNLILQKAKLPEANQLKRYNEVIVSGEKLLKEASADAGVVKDVAKAYYYTKKYQKAIDLFKMLETMAMQNEATLYYTALSYRALKNYPEAAIYTKKTIDEAISPNTSSYYSLLGLVYEESNQLTLANTAYKKGLQFKVTPALYYRLAVFYDTKLKQSANALKYYNLYLKSKPDVKDDKDEIKFVKDRLAQLNLAD